MFDKILQISEEEMLFSKEDKDVYRYGYQLIKETLIQVVLALMIAVFLNKVSVLILFSAFFVPLRSFSGGYHAKNATLCAILSNLVLLATYWANDFLHKHPLHVGYIVVCMVVFAIVICALSPIDSRAKRLTDSQKIKYRRIVIGIVLIEMVIQVCMLPNKTYLVCVVFLVQMISLLAAKGFCLDERV